MEGPENVGEYLMDSFKHGVGLRVADCRRDGLNGVAAKELLKTKASEFSAVIEEAMSRTWITR